MRLPFHSVIIAAVVCLVFWVIFLGGVGGITKKCNDQAGFSSSDCGYNHGLKWFSLFFQLLVVGLTAAATFTGWLSKVRLALVSYATVAALLFIYHSDELVRVTYFQENVLKRGKAFAAYGTAAAGAVLLAIYNLVLILYVSVVDDDTTATTATNTTIPTRQVDLGPEHPVQAKAVEGPKVGAPPPVTAATTNV